MISCPVCIADNHDTETVCQSCGAAIGSSPTTQQPSHILPPGTQLQGGAYTVGKKLGQGGFGITYQGTETRLSRLVAIKEFFPEKAIRSQRTVQPGQLDPQEYANLRAGFLDEARVIARMSHPGIVHVYTSFEENGTAYMVMELLKGHSLQSEIDARGALSERQAVGIIEQVGEALNAVHLAGFLHRDMKPDNVILTDDGRVVLIDFGTARAFAADKTRRMTVMLTTGYAPLEQYSQSGRFGKPTDIHALAAMLYHLLTGQLPVVATDRATGVRLPAPAELNPAIHKPVSEAVMWAMEMQAAARPQTVGDFLKALRGQMAAPAQSASGSVPTTQNALKFKQGAATSLSDLVQLCDRYPDEAEDYLFGSGHFLETWLGQQLGEAALAKEAEQIRQDNAYRREHRRGLEMLLRAACREAKLNPYPQLAAQPAQVDFGQVPAGAKQTLRVRLVNRDRGHAWGSISVEGNLPGVTSTPAFDSASAPIDVEMDGLNVPPGKYTGALSVQATGVPTVLKIPVSFEVVPVVVKIRPDRLQFERVAQGNQVQATLDLTTTPGGGRVKGSAQLAPPVPGVSFPVSFEGTSYRLDVAIDTSKMEGGRTYRSSLVLTTNLGRFVVPFVVGTRMRWELVFGWAGGLGLVCATALGLARSAIVSAGATQWIGRYVWRGDIGTLNGILGLVLACLAAALVLANGKRG